MATDERNPRSETGATDESSRVRAGTEELDSVEVDAPNASLRAVSTDETVVRIIKTPWHFANKAKTRLKGSAFRPPPESNEISVVQQNYGGDDYCKQMAKKEVGESYQGLAPGLVSEVIRAGAGAVVETPEENFPGHADIISPLTMPPKGEVLPAEDAKILADFTDALVAHFIYYEDTARDEDGWPGPPLARSA